MRPVPSETQLQHISDFSEGNYLTVVIPKSNKDAIDIITEKFKDKRNITILTRDRLIIHEDMSEFPILFDYLITANHDIADWAHHSNVPVRMLKMDIKKSQRRYLYKLLGSFFTMGMTIIMYALFLLAFFGNDGYRHCIDINSYNEAYLEFIIIPIFLFFGFYSIYVLLKERYRLFA